MLLRPFQKTTLIQSLRKFLKLTKPELSDEEIEKTAETQRKAALSIGANPTKYKKAPVRHNPTAIKPFGQFQALRPFETPRKATPKTAPTKAEKKRQHNLEKFKLHQNWLKVHAKPEVQG